MKEYVNNKIVFFYVTFGQMPSLMKLISIACLGFGMVVILPFLPFETIILNGERVSREYFWSSGHALVAVFAGVYLFSCGIGFVYRKRLARLAFVLFLPVLYIVQLLLSMETDSFLVAIFGYSIWSLIFTWYLYYKQNVRSFFLIE